MNDSKEMKGFASDLREVAELAAETGRSDEVLERALDALAAVTPYDIAAFWILQGDRLVVQTARGALASAALRRHSIPLSDYPTVREAIDEGAARLLGSAGRAPNKGTMYGDLCDLPEDCSCLLTPVVTGDRVFGVLTLHHRTKERYAATMLDIANVYGNLIGLGLAVTEQADRSEADRERLAEHNRLLEESGDAEPDACRAIEMWTNREMRRVAQMARQVATTDSPVLITGETGTGKDVLARAIHGWSGRADRTFVAVNCGALPESLIESELFGHRRGAFSGADRDRPGRFRVADGGTLFLDEVGELPEPLQVKLLRVLESGSFTPVGADRPVQVDVRILAASNRDLVRAIEEGRFREDLFYRLNVFPIGLPPLRERPEDIPALTRAILERIRRRTGRGPWSVGEDTMVEMQRYAWPGNVRELVNTLERARVLAPEGGELDVQLAPMRQTPAAGSNGIAEEWPKLKDHERTYIRRVLRRTSGKIYGNDGAAAILGMPPTTLQSRMARLGINRLDH